MAQLNIIAPQAPPDAAIPGDSVEQMIDKLNSNFDEIYTGDFIVPREQIIDERDQGDTIYIGKADPGELESAATWQIQKVTFTRNGALTETEIRFADNDTNFDNIWDDRTTLDYTP